MNLGFTRRAKPGQRATEGGWAALNAVFNDRTLVTLSFLERTMWTKPEFTEMRFGFEVTMYIANR